MNEDLKDLITLGLIVTLILGLAVINKWKGRG